MILTFELVRVVLVKHPSGARNALANRAIRCGGWQPNQSLNCDADQSGKALYRQPPIRFQGDGKGCLVRVPIRAGRLEPA